MGVIYREMGGSLGALHGFRTCEVLHMDIKQHHQVVRYYSGQIQEESARSANSKGAEPEMTRDGEREMPLRNDGEVDPVPLCRICPGVRPVY